MDSLMAPSAKTSKGGCWGEGEARGGGGRGKNGLQKTNRKGNADIAFANQFLAKMPAQSQTRTSALCCRKEQLRQFLAI